MPQLLASAPELGTVGMAILAVILAVFLALKALDLYQHRNGKVTSNGNGNGVSRARLEQLRMICPFGTGRRSLDDLHDVLVSLDTTLDAVARSQEQLAKDTRDLHLEIARQGD